MWLLAQHPAVQDKLRAEVSEMLGHVPEPDMMDLKGLKYLDAVVKWVFHLAPDA
jgi:cytochrome P450